MIENPPCLKTDSTIKTSGTFKPPLERMLLAGLSVVTAAAVGSLWVGNWPDPKPKPLPWSPDAIVVLGGGDRMRAQEGIRMAEHYPAAPVIVTGDGGYLWKLLEPAISSTRLLSEPKATSTFENATFTAPMLEALGARRVLIVTNWFHAPRALAVFRKAQPGREFAVAFSRKPDPMPSWDTAAQRRERFACAAYLLLHGVWCF